MITELKKHEIFVFGSNGKGSHGAGAALMALERFGAINGVSEGIQGQSYGINTMDGLGIIKEQVKRFKKYAERHPELKFLMTPIGTGIAGYTHYDMKVLFKTAPNNVVLPDEWIE